MLCLLSNQSCTHTQSGIKGSDVGDDANIKLDIYPEITDMTIQLDSDDDFGNVGE